MEKAELTRTLNNLFKKYGQRFGARYEVRSGTEILVKRGNPSGLADLTNPEIRQSLSQMMVDDLMLGMDRGRGYAQSIQRALNQTEQDIRVGTRRANQTRSSEDIREVQRLQGQATGTMSVGAVPGGNLRFFTRYQVGWMYLRYFMELCWTAERRPRPR